MTDRRSIPRAFTLIELICVMALMLAMLAMAAPRLDNFARGRVLTSHAQLVLDQLNAARDRAVVRAVRCRFVVDADRRTTAIAAQRAGVYETIGDSLGRPVDMPQGLAVSVVALDGSGEQPDQWIEISPLGGATPAAVRVQDRTGEARYIFARTAFEPFVIRDALEEAEP